MYRKNRTWIFDAERDGKWFLLVYFADKIDRRLGLVPFFHGVSASGGDRRDRR